MTTESTEDPLSGLFVALAGVLLAIGTLMVYSSSVTARPSAAEEIALSRHLLFLLGAGLAGIAVSQLPADIWKKAAPVLFLLTLTMLLAVLLPGLGTSVNGARRWIRLGSLSMQPSETAKLTLPLLLCAWRSGGATGRIPDRRESAWCLGAIGLTMLLILVEPDLGTALVVGFTGCLALFLSGWPFRRFLYAGAAAVPPLLLLLALQPYQLGRLRGFVATWMTPDQAPYQVQQSLTTLGVGGLCGTGLGRGWQKLSFLPEANTDFVFAVIGEELGLMGTLSVALVWAGLYVLGLKLIQRAPRDSFNALLARVLLAQLVIQAVINMAVVTALLPPKGISHPFISYGGSSLLVSILAIAMILSLTRPAPPGTATSNCLPGNDIPRKIPA